jgi:hypothetical protein
VPEREQRELAAWSKSVEVLVVRQVRSRVGCAGETLVSSTGVELERWRRAERGRGVGPVQAYVCGLERACATRE